MSEHRKLLVARSVQWIFYVGIVGFLLDVLGAEFLAPPAYRVSLLFAPLGMAMAAGLTMILSPFLLTCRGCGAPYFDVPLGGLMPTFAQRRRMGAVMWKPVPQLCPSCGLDRA